MVFPLGVRYQPPKTMPEDAQKLFVEAQRISTISPRAACVLSRVCLERIVDVAGADIPGFNPNDPLYKKILSLNLGDNMQKICDACRLTGNAGAHAGTVVFSEQDSKNITEKLFVLIVALTQQLLVQVADFEFGFNARTFYESFRQSVQGGLAKVTLASYAAKGKAPCLQLVHHFNRSFQGQCSLLYQ